LNTLICRKYSLQKLTQFSLGNNFLNATASTGMVVFGEIHVFLQISRIGLCGTKPGFLHLENYDVQEYYIQKLT
jgi:hypothetical protein